MKKRHGMKIALLLLVILMCSACSLNGRPQTDKSIPSPAGLSTSGGSLTATQKPPPSPVVASESMQANVYDPMIIFTSEGSVPAPDGGKWYDWDVFGMYPNQLYFGHTYAADEKNLYYFKPLTSGEDYKNGALLCKCDFNGSNEQVIQVIGEPFHETAHRTENLNCYKEWLYYSTDKAVYKVKKDGTGLTRLTDLPAYDLLIADGKILCTLTNYESHIEDDDSLYQIGENGLQKLGDVGLPFLSYDSGVLYNGVHIDDGGTVEMYGSGGKARSLGRTKKKGDIRACILSYISPL